jgi:uncharacterized SAM-binding protein YcdF (DUF218 family)
MFYYLSKIFWLFAAPSTVLALLALAGMLLGGTRFSRVGKRLALASLFLLFALGIGPLGNWLLLPLESRFPVITGEASTPPAGIIVLGGAVDDRITSARVSPMELNEAGDRVLAMIGLAQRYPATRIIFTGGAADVIGTTAEPEAAAVKARIAAFGLDPERIIFEDRSRNTHENALFTHTIANPKAGEEWWLVTSAFHMPRAIGVFRKAGFAVKAYPVDFRTAGLEDGYRIAAPLSSGLGRADLAAKEWISLLAYWLTGKTDRLFPAP